MSDDNATGNIHRPPGVALSIPGEANPKVVATLEAWLEKAKNGEITFIMLGGIRSLDRKSEFQTSGIADANTVLSLATAVFTLAQDTWKQGVSISISELL